MGHQQRPAALHPERGRGKQEGVMEKRRRRLTRRWNGRTLRRVKEGEKAEGRRRKTIEGGAECL